MANLSSLMPPGARGYLAGEEQAKQAGTRNLANISQATQIRGALEKLQENQALKQALADAGGDPEKALEGALKAGNVAAAQHLAPIVKLRQEQRQREETVKGMQQIYGQPGQPAATQGETPPQQLGEGQPIAVAGEQPQPLTPGRNPQRESRLGQLQQMSLLYAHNPVVMQRIQAEMDKLNADAKPMVEHNFPVQGGKEPMVQPHISLDGGNTWKPIPGSQPSPKFANRL